jgi:hypothetical protein
MKLADARGGWSAWRSRLLQANHKRRQMEKDRHAIHVTLAHPADRGLWLTAAPWPDAHPHE